MDGMLQPLAQSNDPIPWGAEPPQSVSSFDVLPASTFAQDGYCGFPQDVCTAANDYRVRVGSTGANAAVNPFGVTGLFGLGQEWLLDTRDGAPPGDFPQYNCETVDCAYTFESKAAPYRPGQVQHMVRGGVGGSIDCPSANGGVGSRYPQWGPRQVSGQTRTPQWNVNSGAPCSTNYSLRDAVGFRCARDR